MFTRDDLIDLIVSQIGHSPHPKAGENPDSIPAPDDRRKMYPNSMLPKGRIFLTEREIRKGLTPSGQHLTIPRDAIISPLAVDWLVLNGIEITRE